MSVPPFAVRLLACAALVSSVSGCTSCSERPGQNDEAQAAAKAAEPVVVMPPGAASLRGPRAMAERMRHALEAGTADGGS